MRNLLLFSCLLATSTLPLQADPVAELGAFSVFPNASLDKLKGQVVSDRGPIMSNARHISVQSAYVVALPPAKALEALQQWDASRHRELKIYLHGDLPTAPTAASFAKLGSAPENGAVRALVEQTAKGSAELQLSKGEAAALPAASKEAFQTFWTGVLAGRASRFAGGGAAGQPAYDHTGQNVSPGDEISGLLRGQEKVRKQFAGFLGENGALGGRGSLKKDLYFELIDVEDEGALTLGSFSSKPVGGGFQAADVTYYSSGGYYAGITLYQMWPVDVGGVPSTLVWRGDLISSASLANLHGVERLASESAMIKDVTKAVRLLKGDMGK